MKRTLYCGELRKEHVGKEVICLGWVRKQRDMGNLVFIDLRDREGIVQVVTSSNDQSLHNRAKNLKMEYVVGVRGIVRERDKNSRNPQMPTGDVEIEAKEIKVLNTSEVPPFVIEDPPQATEELRFKYRYLDLRRPGMQENLKIRHQAMLTVRNFLSGQGFYEIETPFLTKSTPEGARDYLVPSRVYKGRFFALPQSPQIFKQLLMIAGMDKYFQIVRCFRDEDLRSDRQPEFTQIDIEMSFGGRETVFELVEAMMTALFEQISVKVTTPFPRFTHQESMERYGTDKPDLRFDLEIQDLTDLGTQLGSDLIQKILGAGGELKGLLVRNKSGLSRGQLDKINQRAKDLGGKGVIWIKKAGEFKSSLKLEAKAFEILWDKLNGKEDDLALLVADEKTTALKVLGGLREDFCREDPKASNEFKHVWITDFPLFEWSEEEDRLVSVHHPFTSPYDEDIVHLEKEPLRVRARAYDIVLNGFEIGGGSIRIHDINLQKRIFRKLGLSDEEAEEKFGFFLEALKYGVPPHGGIAMGFDRIVMLLAGEESIREVIPFPKTTSSLCLLTGSPSGVRDAQLKELGLKKSVDKDEPFNLN